MRVSSAQRRDILAISEIFRAKIIDISPDSLMMEITGNQSKIEALMNQLDAEGYEILELARTGIAGLGRGIENVTYL